MAIDWEWVVAGGWERDTWEEVVEWGWQESGVCERGGVRGQACAQ